MAKALWLSGAALVVAGLSLLLYFIALLFWEFGAFRQEVLGAILRSVDHAVLTLWSHRPPAWLTSLHIGMAVALLGVAVGSLGVLVARRQWARIRAEKMRMEDRLRRAHLYRDGDRVEPFIGSGPDDESEDSGKLTAANCSLRAEPVTTSRLRRWEKIDPVSSS